MHYYWAAHKDKKCEAIFLQQKQIAILHLTVIFSVLLRCYVFFFFSVFSDLSGLNRIRSLFKQLILNNAETDVPLTSLKCRVEVAKIGHTMMQNESI